MDKQEEKISKELKSFILKKEQKEQENQPAEQKQAIADEQQQMSRVDMARQIVRDNMPKVADSKLHIINLDEKEYGYIYEKESDKSTLEDIKKTMAVLEADNTLVDLRIDIEDIKVEIESLREHMRQCNCKLAGVDENGNPVEAEPITEETREALTEEILDIGDLITELDSQLNQAQKDYQAGLEQYNKKINLLERCGTYMIDLEKVDERLDEDDLSEMTKEQRYEILFKLSELGAFIKDAEKLFGVKKNKDMKSIYDIIDRFEVVKTKLEPLAKKTVLTLYKEENPQQEFDFEDRNKLHEIMFGSDIGKIVDVLVQFQMARVSYQNRMYNDREFLMKLGIYQLLKDEKKKEEFVKEVYRRRIDTQMAYNEKVNQIKVKLKDYPEEEAETFAYFAAFFEKEGEQSIAADLVSQILIEFDEQIPIDYLDGANDAVYEEYAKKKNCSVAEFKDEYDKKYNHSVAGHELREKIIKKDGELVSQITDLKKKRLLDALPDTNLDYYKESLNDERISRDNLETQYRKLQKVFKDNKKGSPKSLVKDLEALMLLLLNEKTSIEGRRDAIAKLKLGDGAITSYYSNLDKKYDIVLPEEVGNVRNAMDVFVRTLDNYYADCVCVDEIESDMTSEIEKLTQIENAPLANYYNRVKDKTVSIKNTCEGAKNVLENVNGYNLYNQVNQDVTEYIAACFDVKNMVREIDSRKPVRTPKFFDLRRKLEDCKELVKGLEDTSDTKHKVKTLADNLSMLMSECEGAIDLLSMKITNTASKKYEDEY